jgi:uncharacterized protein (TIGR02246 family)
MGTSGGRAILALGALLLAACETPGRGGPGDAGAAREIRARLERWPQDFNARNTAAVCDLFAPDVVLSFPGTPDRDHGAMCRGFATALADPGRTLRYDAPDIRSVEVSGDLAVVRLVWTLRVTDRRTGAEAVEREIGLDVFRRQPDGLWRITVSHAYPEEAR